MATINPLRYRGYYYDSETGFYYLQSRYYDPTICRFINADSFASTGQSVLGYNMFAYCNNSPVSCYDSSGTAAISVYNGDRNPLYIGYIGMGGGAGGGTGGGGAGSAGKYKAPPLWHTDPEKARESLKENGFTVYKGALVFMCELLFDKSAFSFGIIVLDDFYKDASDKLFKETLNHERGHAVHFSQVGPVVYAVTTAAPSLIGAGLSYLDPWVKEHYFSLPWERIADYLGDVDRGDYLPGADTAATIFWLITQIAGIAWEVAT